MTYIAPTILSAILISHPHAVHNAVGMAMALQAEGKLAAFETGIAFGAATVLGQVAQAATSRYPLLRNRILTAEPVRSHPVVEAAARLLARMSPQNQRRANLYNNLFTFHDWAVATSRWPSSVTAVYAYEDGALRTFQRAKRQGLERIWDLPLPHYATIEALINDERRRWPDAMTGPTYQEPDWKRRRKEAELGLATRVSVASAFTRKSLEGRTSLPVHVTPYGFPVEEFTARAAPPTGPFRVLSVGTHDLRKGTPYLLEAWKRAAIPDAELHLIGPLRLSKPFLDRYAGLFVHRPHAAKKELADIYPTADLLAFPTLGDGFGLVIQEAMCCATPVVTTPCGGGPECITDGVDGWIVAPRDVDALVHRFRAAAADRDACARVGRAARARAERGTWTEAGRSFLREIGA